MGLVVYGAKYSRIQNILKVKKLLIILLLLFPVHGAWGAYTTPTDATCKDGKQEYSEAQKYMPLESPDVANKASEWLIKAYKKGCGDAAFDLATISELIFRDQKSKEDWYKRSAELDHPDGLIMHGVILAEKGDKAKGCKLIKEGGALGANPPFGLSVDKVLAMSGC